MDDIDKLAVRKELHRQAFSGFYTVSLDQLPLTKELLSNCIEFLRLKKSRNLILSPGTLEPPNVSLQRLAHAT
jgi:hypothetical protein